MSGSLCFRGYTVWAGLWETTWSYQPVASDPIGFNYQPALHRATIADGTSELSVALERVAGVASLAKGELEVKMLRDNTVDDCHTGPPDHDTSLLSQHVELSIVSGAAQREGSGHGAPAALPGAACQLIFVAVEFE